MKLLNISNTNNIQSFDNSNSLFLHKHINNWNPLNLFVYQRN